MSNGGNVPLSVIANVVTNGTAFVGVGNQKYSQGGQGAPRGLWFLILDNSTLKPVYNALWTQVDTVPPIQQWNDSNHIMIVASNAMGLNSQPVGNLFTFLDVNGAGAKLRGIAQIAAQFNCGYLGTYGYALVGTLGNQNIPGFEASAPTGGNPASPVLTLALMPITINGTTTYSPVALSD
jgi:hypothetical protein